MFTELRLNDFKSFSSAELKFGSITAIIGANASGKSNVRDALKFLHGVGCGMSLPEILDGQSTKQWGGIRGGAAGTVRQGQRLFKVQLIVQDLSYTIAVTVTPKGPLVTYEALFSGSELLFETYPLGQIDAKILDVKVGAGGDFRRGQRVSLPSHQPILSQVSDAASSRKDWKASLLLECADALRSKLSDIRFIDFSPMAMREPSQPGAKSISESGHNLSSVLHYLVLDQKKESVLASWIQALTPMDVSRIVFEGYPDGRTLAILIESSGNKVPISNASDGTLRFLGILASVLSPESTSLLCFEEIETGLHPIRVQLVSELLQKETSDDKPQVLLTTHSPGLIGWLGDAHREHAYLSYRLPQSAETKLKAFRQIPNLENALQKAEASRLFESGWFEDAVFFSEGEQTPLVLDEEPEEEGKK